MPKEAEACIRQESVLEKALFPLVSDESVLSLLADGENPIFKDGSTVLHKAVFWDYASLTVKLCRHFPNLLDYCDREGKRPIDIAIACHHHMTTAVLLQTSSTYCIDDIIAAISPESQPWGNGALIAYLQKQILDNDIIKFKSAVDLFRQHINDDEVSSKLFMYSNCLIEKMITSQRPHFIAYVSSMPFAHYLSDGDYLKAAVATKNKFLIGVVFEALYKQLILESNRYKIAQWLDEYCKEPSCLPLCMSKVAALEPMLKRLREMELDQYYEEDKEDKLMRAVAKEMCYAYRVLKHYKKHKAVQEQNPARPVKGSIVRALTKRLPQFVSGVSLFAPTKPMTRSLPPSPTSSRATSPVILEFMALV